MRRILLVLAALPLFAQLHNVDIKVSGIDCASCATSVPARLKRIRGVEAAAFDPAKSMVSVRLAADNKVTLAAIRDALKGLGYTPGDATLVIRTSVPPNVSDLTPSSPVLLEGTTAAGSNEFVPRVIKAE